LPPHARTLCARHTPPEQHFLRPTNAPERTPLGYRLPAFDDLADLPLERYPHTLLLPRIWDYRDNLTAYDATYLALADALDCPVWTRDTRFANAPPAIGRVRLF
jgi:hypothetical protein